MEIEYKGIGGGGTIPPFTAYEPCIVCQGRGWKRQRNGYSLVTCPACLGTKKLPRTGADGNWIKK